FGEPNPESPRKGAHRDAGRSEKSSPFSSLKPPTTFVPSSGEALRSQYRKELAMERVRPDIAKKIITSGRERLSDHRFDLVSQCPILTQEGKEVLRDLILEIYGDETLSRLAYESASKG